VRAQIRARDVVVHGKVDGNVNADRVELKKSAIHVGNVVTQRVIVEDGAFFKGSIDIQREQKAEVKPEAKTPVAAAASVSSSLTSSSTPAANAAPAQASLLEPKKR
jgi:cytoskeletal protein CcmA (bactofilin family)